MILQPRPLKTAGKLMLMHPQAVSLLEHGRAVAMGVRARASNRDDVDNYTAGVSVFVLMKIA